ncbi:hypothetical protein ABEB36_015537 [Hypothenemus hampei]|uniref:Uncharacterized protein n=1 Tax=Hypothenemus hampei TaxID=57062 RepID=A0ABD1DZF6_HYPHA
MQDDPSPSRRRDAAQHRPPTTVSPPTTTSEENAVTHAPAVDGMMVSRPGECGTRERLIMPYPLKTPLFLWP